MTPEQEEKFKAWIKRIKWGDIANSCKTAWIACLEANGIGEDVKGKDDEAAAPQWVIDMIRTGNPVRCKVWNGPEYTGDTTFIDGYRIGAQYPFLGVQRWQYAEPIPAWKPKDGESVLFCDDDNHGRAMAGFIRNGILYARGLMCADWEKREKVKPFDASKIGKPWSEA